MTTYKQVVDEAGDIERHADPIDIASDRSQQEVNHLVREASARVEEDAKAAADAVTGCCLHCGESVAPPRRWCDAYCRDSQAAEERSRTRRGY